MKVMTKLAFALISATIVVVLFMIAMTGCDKINKPDNPTIPKHKLIKKENLGGSCTVTHNRLTGKKQYECTSSGPEKNDPDR